MHSTTLGETGQDEVGDCKCDAEFYLAVAANGDHTCEPCPTGGLCPESRICALALEGFNCDNETGADILGNWTRENGTDKWIIEACPAGSEIVGIVDGNYNQQQCKECISGFYYSLNYIDGCQVCPPGLECTGGGPDTTVVVNGSIFTEGPGGILNLTYCPEGYFIFDGRQDSDGNVSDGAVFDPTVQECVACGLGKYLPREGEATCQWCPAGTFKDTITDDLCTDCPADTYRVEEGATSCSMCTPCPMHSTTLGETGQDEVGDCKCDAEFYLVIVGGNHTCVPCPAGGLCPESRICALALDSFSCDEDKESDIVGNWTRQNSTDRYIIESCPDGYELIGMEDGEVTDFNAIECKACIGGFFYSLNAEDGCQKCPPGLTCTGGGPEYEVVVEESVWTPGENGTLNLVSCPEGWLVYNGTTDEYGVSNGKPYDATVQECVSCPIGWEFYLPANATGPVCRECQAGFYKDNSAPVYCRACPVNYYLTTTGGDSVTDCVACPLGAITEEVGQDSQLDCKCTGRYYQDSEPGVEPLSCKFCPTAGICADGTCAFNIDIVNPTCDGERLAGNWSIDAGSNWKVELDSCPNGYMKMSTNQPAGDLKAEHDDQICVKCASAQYNLDSNTFACQNCPPGLFCDGTKTVKFRLNGSTFEQVNPTDDTLTLTKCPVNYQLINKNEAGVVDPTVQECVACDAGYDCVAGGCAQGQCDLCEAGSYKEAGRAETCTLCPLNTYNPVSGSISVDACIPCPLGAITQQTGSSSVTQCVCDDRQYEAGTNDEPYCETCPIGALCLTDGVCALHPEDSNNDGCKVPEEFIGTWTQTGPNGTYQLISCPDGFSRQTVIASEGVDAVSHDQQQCYPCLIDEYVTDSNKYKCQKCPPGLECTGTETIFEVVEDSDWVKNGSIYELIMCPTGYVLWNGTNNGGAFNAIVQECRACGFGEQCSPSSAECHECAECPAGTYKDSISTDMCTPCPLNTYSEEKGEDDVSTCTACPNGTYTRSDGSVNLTQCICFGRQYRAGDRCINCPVGAVCQDGTCGLSYPDPAGSPSNFTCPGASEPIDGTWLRNPDQTYRLETCGIGFEAVKEPHDLQECIRCSTNSYQMAADQECKRCPRFLYCNGTTTVTEVVEGSVKFTKDDFYRLQHCPAGYAAYYEVVAGEVSEECIPCGPGTECKDPTGCGQIAPATPAPTVPTTPSPTPSPTPFSNETAVETRATPSPTPSGTNETATPSPTPASENVTTPVTTPADGRRSGEGRRLLADPDSVAYTKNTCTACQPGTYKDFTGSIDCRECPADTYSDSIGAATDDTCTLCPAYSSTLGQTGRTAYTDCICDEPYYPIFLNGRDNLDGFECRLCPAGAICEDGSCAFNYNSKPISERPDYGTCPGTGSEPIGNWTLDPETEIRTLIKCPPGYQFPDDGQVEECIECTRCPDYVNGSWCRTADYIIDQYANECESCPIGAICDGSDLAPPFYQQELGPNNTAVWVDGGDGRFYLKSCPLGHQLINNTGYELQQCLKCDLGEYVERSDDPAYVCEPCPPHHHCPLGTPPVFTDVVNVQVYIVGVNISDMYEGSWALDSALQAMAETVGLEIGYILFFEVCDDIGQNCVTINARVVQESALARQLQFGKVSNHTFDDALFAADDNFIQSRRNGVHEPIRRSKRRQDGGRDGVYGAGEYYDGESGPDPFGEGFIRQRACGPDGVLIRMKLMVPIRPDLSAYDIQLALVQDAYADRFHHLYQYFMGLGNYTEICGQIISAGLDGTSQGRIGWVYNITEEGIIKLVYCPEGYLLINTTIEEQECWPCPKGTYSFDPYDGCVNGTCASRWCNPCPDDPHGGAICCGKNLFDEILDDSLWQNHVFDWGGFTSTVRRIEKCPSGWIIIRNESDPTTDHCYRCPPYTFNYDGLYNGVWYEGGNGSLAYASMAEYDIAQTTQNPPCLPCPPGSICYGGDDITEAEGYWQGDIMDCPPEACTSTNNGPVVCIPDKCFPTNLTQVVSTSGDNVTIVNTGRRLMEVNHNTGRRRLLQAGQTGACTSPSGLPCRPRVYIHTCPAGSCQTSGVCVEGTTGPACGICAEGWARVGIECQKCEQDLDYLRNVLIAIAVPILLIMFYFASWRPLLYASRKTTEEEAAEEEAKPPSRLELLAVQYKAFDLLNKVWINIRRWWNQTSFVPYVKIIISFYNIVGTYPTVFNIYWPHKLAVIFQITNSLAGVDPLGLPDFICLSNTLSYETKLLINTITPMAINAIFFIAPLIVMLQGLVMRGHPFKHPNFQATISRFCWSMCFTLGLYYPPVSINVVGSFRCDPILKVIVSDYSEPCPNFDQDGFIFRWSVLMTFVYPFGIPVALFLMMRYYNVPKIARAKMDKVLLKAIIGLYQKENSTQESEMLVRIIGSVSDKEQFKQRVGELFEMIDKDGGGSLDLDEMIEAFHKFGMEEVDREKMLKLMAKFGADENTEIEPDKFYQIISEMTAISFLFTGHEEELDDLSIDQMRALSSYDWGMIGKPKVENLKRPPAVFTFYLPDMDDPAAMGPWILDQARTLRSEGKLAVPKVPWDGAEVDLGEPKAIARLGMVFSAYQVEYWYYDLYDMMKKLIMTSLLSFFMYGTASQLFLGFFILAFFLLTVLRSQPFSEQLLNSFQIYSYLVQCVTMLYGICILADTDVDSAASPMFSAPGSWLSELIVVIVVSLALFPIFVGIAGSRWVKKMWTKAKHGLDKKIDQIKEAVLPSYFTAKNRKLRSAKLLDDQKKRSNSLPDANDMAFEHAQDPMSANFKNGAKLPHDVEMVPGFNCGPGIFRMYDVDTKMDQLEDNAHAELVFTARSGRSDSEDGSETDSDEEDWSDSASDYTGSMSARTYDDETATNATGRSIDIQPEPRLGPARVRAVELDNSSADKRAGVSMSETTSVASSRPEKASNFTRPGMKGFKGSAAPSNAASTAMESVAETDAETRYSDEDRTNATNE